jgi:selenocysteine lyase/cysteine desulfurase
MTLLEGIGLENIARQIQALTQYLMKGARNLGIQIKTPSNSVGPLVVLQSNNVEAIVERLAVENVICSGRRDGLRISFHVHNNRDDVEAVLEVLKKNRKLMQPSANAA